jgi:hypothetical protein
MLELLSKESIRSGKSDEIAQQVAQTNQAIQYLRENEDSVTESVSKAVEGEVGELNIDIEAQSREFVQSLVSVLSEQRHFVSENSEEMQSDAEPQAESEPHQTDVNRRAGYIIRFSDGAEIPQSDKVVQTQQNQNMGAAVDYLIEEYNLIEEIEVPYSPPHARKNCLINDRPVHPNGEQMRGAYELVNGYFLHTSLNTQAKQNRLRDLAEKVGLNVKFLSEW